MYYPQNKVYPHVMFGLKLDILGIATQNLCTNYNNQCDANCNGRSMITPDYRSNQGNASSSAIACDSGIMSSK